MSTRILEARRSLEQYREFEPLPDPNREQEIAEDADEGKYNLFPLFFLWACNGRCSAFALSRGENEQYNRFTYLLYS